MDTKTIDYKRERLGYYKVLIVAAKAWLIVMYYICLKD